jgi:hypothetical protein
MAVPDYFARLGIAHTVKCADVIRQKFVDKWTELHQRVDLNIEQVQEKSEELLIAMEMLQCEDSRKCILSAMATGQLKCRLPPAIPLTWGEAVLLVEEEGAPGPTRRTNAEQLEKGGYQWKMRRVPDEETFVQWVRYHCSFNAYAILGVPYNATPEQVRMAYSSHAIGLDLDKQEQKNYTLCLETACNLATCDRLSSYHAWLAQGFIDTMYKRVPMRLPATRTNLLEAIAPPIQRRNSGNTLDKWLKPS